MEKEVLDRLANVELILRHLNFEFESRISILEERVKKLIKSKKKIIQKPEGMVSFPENIEKATLQASENQIFSVDELVKMTLDMIDDCITDHTFCATNKILTERELFLKVAINLDSIREHLELLNENSTG